MRALFFVGNFAAYLLLFGWGVYQACLITANVLWSPHPPGVEEIAGFALLSALIGFFAFLEWLAWYRNFRFLDELLGKTTFAYGFMLALSALLGTIDQRRDFHPGDFRAMAMLIILVGYCFGCGAYRNQEQSAPVSANRFGLRTNSHVSMRIDLQINFAELENFLSAFATPAGIHRCVKVTSFMHQDLQ